MPRIIGHIDADCFYVSAERVRFASLRGIPVGVLGNQGTCVIAKSYEAKAAGAEDGEAFAILTSNPLLPTRVKLDLRLVEADQIATPDLNPLRAGAIEGIVFDESGNPTE